jgi:hypothetical protein
MQLQSRKEVLEMQNTALRLLTKCALIGFLAVAFPASAAARGFHRGGHRVIVPHYSYIYPDWGWGWGWWGYPSWGYSPYYYEGTGRVKIHDHNKYDQVYINGAYAGRVEKLKNIKLEPGHYTIEIRQQGKVLVNQSIYVVADKTVDIDVAGG